MNGKVQISTMRIFEAAARWQSFHAAASELHLTPSAVSHAIKKMEEALGVELFERRGRRVSLSSEGQTLMGYTERGFDELDRGLDAVSARPPQLLRLHCAPSFASQWLTPRLGNFFAEHVEVEVRLSIGGEYARFDTGEFDADIMYGLPTREGLTVLPLKEETVTPLCAPYIAETIRSPADLLRYPLIQSELKQVRWPNWFALNGLAAPSEIRGPRFDRSYIALMAAADGLGIALESTLLADREISRGRLMSPLAGTSEEIRYVGHHLVYPPAFERRPQLRLFAQWLARELGVELPPFS